MKANALPPNLKHILKQDSARLTLALEQDLDTSRIETQALLQQVLNVTRAYILAHTERYLTDFEQATYEALLQRRLNGEPIAYLLGKREFFGLTFKVTPATLIPRPETELLVELALQRIPPPDSPHPDAFSLLAGERSRQAGRGKIFRVLDLGTGSGAIALSIAHERPEVEVVVVDCSAEALVVARENAAALAIGNVTFMKSDWYDALGTQCFDLIISNPPYVAAGDPHLNQGDLRFEPITALVSGDQGLNDLRRIVEKAHAHLHSGGWLMVEHGYDQASEVRKLMQQSHFKGVISSCDLAGIERVTLGQMTSV